MVKCKLNNKEKILVVIPARGGSKSIKGKNLKKINGKHLITYTIDAALKLKKFFYKIIVSTDNHKIASICVCVICDMLMIFYDICLIISLHILYDNKY